MSTTQAVDYDALAEQAGAISSTPAAPAAPATSATSAAPASGGIDYDALAKQAGAISSQPARAPGAPSALAAHNPWKRPDAPDADNSSTHQGAVGNLVEGVGKEAAESIRGGVKLVNDVLPAGMQLPVPAEHEDLSRQGWMQNIGAGAEQVAEWTLGEEGLGALKEFASASKYLKTPQMLTAFLKSSPKVADALTAVAHGIAIGGAQGAVHGADAGDAKGGAVAGAIGGGVGAGAGEAVGYAGKPLARLFGMGGWTTDEAFTKAGRPSVYEGPTFANAIQTALPIVKDIPPESIKNVGDFVEALHTKANDLWTGTIKPQIDNHASEVLDTKPIRDKIQSAVTRSMAKLDPDGAAEIERYASHFSQPSTLAEASEDLQFLNAKLKAYYKAPPEARAAIIKTDGAVNAMESAADGLRDQIYDKLGELGEKDPRALRQQYGALKDMERVFSKRATVADRQAPLNLQQGIGLLEGSMAVLSGHPVVAAAAAVPFISKARSAPESLIRQGLKTAQAGSGAGPGAVSTLAKKGAAMAGSEANRTREARSKKTIEQKE
jgi:hypothetical protein